MEAHTVGLAKTLSVLGHDILLVDGGALYAPHLDGTPNLRVSNHPIEVPLPSLTFSDCVSMFRKHRGDICIFPKGCFEQGNWCIDLAAKLMFRHYIVIEHLASDRFPEKTTTRHLFGILPGIGLWWYKRRYELILNRFLRYKLPDRVFCVSRTIENQLINIYRFARRKVVTVYNGIDTEKFCPSREHRAASRKRWGIPEDALVFGSVGRLHQIKRFDLALQAFHGISTATGDANVWLVLAGEGPEQESLIQQAKELGIDRRVKFVGFSSQPWEVYPGFDVYVLPSRNEGLPLALLEAMACGCCPIATGVGGIPEVIVNESLGWTVGKDDARGFFEAMNACIGTDKDQLAAKGRAARARVVANYNGKNQYLDLGRLVVQACPAPQPSPGR